MRDGAKQHGHTALHMAAMNNQSSVVRLLLGFGADIHAACEDGCLAVHMAAYSGNLDILTALIKAGTELDRPAGIVRSL